MWSTTIVASLNYCKTNLDRVFERLLVIELVLTLAVFEVLESQLELLFILFNLGT